MSQVTLARVVQAQVVPAETDTEPVVADAPTEVATLDSAGAHGAEDAKVLEIWLAELPPGPTADTRASYMVPPTSGTVSREVNANRIKPSASGLGFPMSIEYDGMEEPVAKI